MKQNKRKWGGTLQIAVIAVAVYILYRLQDLLYHVFWNRKLEVFIRFEDKQVTEGETAVIEETLENRKWLPLPVVFLAFKISRYFEIPGEVRGSAEDRYTRNELMSVMMNQRLKRRVEVLCTKRGIYDIEQASVSAKSLFLDEMYIQEVSCDSKLTVYPCMVDTNRFLKLIQSIYGSQVLKIFMQEDPFLHRGVREYQTYDTMKGINWNATAKTGDMKVNIYEQVASQDAVIYLNVQKESMSVHNEVLEEGIRLAKSFSVLFSKNGVKSALYTNGTNGLDLNPINVPNQDVGLQHISRVNEALTRIHFDETGNVFVHGRNEELDFLELYGEQMEQDAKVGMVVLISNDQSAKMIKTMKKIHKRGGNFLWIVPVDTAVAYREDPMLRKQMRCWRLSFEGASKTGVEVRDAR